MNINIPYFNLSLFKYLRVTYADNSVININTFINVTHKEILDYFAIGKRFNISIGKTFNISIDENTDNIQKVTKCEIVLQVKYHSVDENVMFYQTEGGRIVAKVDGQWYTVIVSDCWMKPDCPVAGYMVIEIEKLRK